LKLVNRNQSHCKNNSGAVFWTHCTLLMVGILILSLLLRLR